VPILRRRPLVLLVLGYALLLGAWVITNPPSAAPDEPGHFAKALAAGDGQFAGEPSGLDPAFIGKVFGAKSVPQLTRSFRAFNVPAASTYQSLPCFAFHENMSARCDRDDKGMDPYISIVGAYPPYTYVPGGIAAKLAQSRQSKLWLARFASAAVSLAFIAAAAWFLWDDDPRKRRFRLLGLIAAVTPMAIFLGSEVGANGIEIAGGVAVGAAVLRLASDPRPKPAVWVVTGICGFVLGLTRPVSPLWLVLDGLLLIAIIGPRRLVSLLRDGGRWAGSTIVLWAGGAVLGYGWLTVHHTRTPLPPLADVHHAAGRTWADMSRVLLDLVGKFGWQDTKLPWPAYAGWAIVVVGLLVAALVFGRSRDRLVLSVSIVTGLVVILAVGGLVIEASGFGMQGRYVLPFFVVIPMLAGDILARAPSVQTGRLARGATLVAAALAAVLLFVGWATNGRRYAVGNRGPVWFIDDAQWKPPGGWLLWAALVAVGTVTVFVSYAIASHVPTRVLHLTDASSSPPSSRRDDVLPAASGRGDAAAGTDPMRAQAQPPARRR
jgi:hypothetical protein